MKLQAIAIDGTVIEFDRAQFTKQGAKLQKQKKQSQQQSGSQQSKQSGSQQASQSKQSNQGQQSTDEEIVLVFDEDVPAEERAELEEQLDESEAQSRTEKSGSASQSQQQSKSQSGGSNKQQSTKQSKSAGNTETIGFITYDRLMYVIPEDVTHNVEDLDNLPA